MPVIKKKSEGKTMNKPKLLLNRFEKEFSFELWQMKPEVFCIFVKENGVNMPEYQVSSRVFKDGKIIENHSETEMRRLFQEIIKMADKTDIDTFVLDESEFDKLVESIESGQYELNLN